MLSQYIGGIVAILVFIIVWGGIVDEMAFMLEDGEFNATTHPLTYDVTKMVIDYKYIFGGVLLLPMIIGLFVPMFPKEEEIINDEGEIEIVNKKQTYLEYVKERLAVERMMK